MKLTTLALYFAFLANLPIKHVDSFTMLLLNSSVHSNDVHYYKHMNRSEIEWHKEAKLLHYLLHDYNPNIIPREYKNESLKLYIGLAMSQLINIVMCRILIKSNAQLCLIILFFFLSMTRSK